MGGLVSTFASDLATSHIRLVRDSPCIQTRLVLPNENIPTYYTSSAKWWQTSVLELDFDACMFFQAFFAVIASQRLGQIRG